MFMSFDVNMAFLSMETCSQTMERRTLFSADQSGAGS